MRNLALDLRLALRILCRNPRPTAATLALLALGLAGVATVAALLAAVVGTPLPYPNSASLAMVWPVQQNGNAVGEEFSLAELIDFQTRFDGFLAVGGYDYQTFTLGDSEQPERLLGARVTPELFEALGVAPVAGRLFAPSEETPGGPQVAVIGFDLWRRHFGANSEAIGSGLRLDDQLYTVIGVMGPEFKLPTDFRTLERSEVWVPLAEAIPAPDRRAAKNLEGVAARLQPGVSREQAQTTLDDLHRQLVAEFPDSYVEGPVGLLLSEPLEDAVSASRPVLALLMTAMALVLAVAIVNGTLLAEARYRQRLSEMSLRAALGAGRWRLLQQLAAEGVLTGLAAGVAALLLVGWALPVAVSRLAVEIPRAQEATVGGFLWWATPLGGAIAGLLTTLPSVLRRRIAPITAVRSTGGGLWWRQAPLLAGQVALSLVLVAAAGLLLSSFVQLTRVDLGFEPRSKVVTFQLNLPRYDYPDQDDVVRTLDRILDGIRSHPAVEDAGAIRRRPLADRLGTWSLLVETGQGQLRPASYPGWQVVMPGFFRAFGVGLLEGRLLEDSDLMGPARSAVINQQMARQYWPDGRAVGRRFRLDGSSDNPWLEVVGVVADVRHEGATGPPRPTLYVPLPHWPEAVGFGTMRSAAVVVRSTLDADELVPTLRRTVGQVDPTLPLIDVASSAEIVADSLALNRRLAALFLILAVLTLLLVCAGIYGAVSLAATARLPEIGIRLALGASGRRVANAFVTRCAAVVAVGIGLGLVLTLASERWLSAFLFGVAAADPAALALASTAVLAACLAAAWPPARKAARSDPLALLRH